MENSQSRWFRHPVGWCNGGRDDAPRGCLARRGIIERAYLSKTSDRIRRNVVSVRGRIAAAARRSGRAEASVELVAVTKKWPAELVRPLVAAGVLDLGENYPQELWRKVESLAELEEPVRWHLIGHLQTNKARRTMPLVRMIHAVDSLKLLQLLDTLAREESKPTSICLQVNTSGEESKHGWSADKILEDADAIAACRSIPIAGLMKLRAGARTPRRPDPRSFNSARPGTRCGSARACRSPSCRWACPAISRPRSRKERPSFAWARRFLKGSRHDRSDGPCSGNSARRARSARCGAQCRPRNARRGAARRGDRAARERQGQRRHRGRARRKSWLSLISDCAHCRGDFAPEAVSRHRSRTR